MYQVTVVFSDSSKPNEIIRLSSLEAASAWIKDKLSTPGYLPERETTDKGIIPSEATFLVQDLEIDYDYQLAKCYSARKESYPTPEHMLHILADHGIDSPEWLELLKEREKVKLNNPKP